MSEIESQGLSWENSDMSVHDLLHRAEEIAREAHKDQKRESGGPYIEHSQRIAESFSATEYEERIVSWLHDVIEDCPKWNYADLVEFPEEILLAIASVTRLPNESYLQFILRSAKNPLGCRVKMADIRDNLRDLKRSARRDKYELALHILTSA